MKPSYAMRKTFALDIGGGSWRHPSTLRASSGGPGPSREAGAVGVAKDHPTTDNGPGAYRCSASAEAVDREER